MIEFSSIDAVPDEREILTLMSNYIAERLFTKRQRRSLIVSIDLTADQCRSRSHAACWVRRKPALVHAHQQISR